MAVSILLGMDTGALVMIPRCRRSGDCPGAAGRTFRAAAFGALFLTLGVTGPVSAGLREDLAHAQALFERGDVAEARAEFAAITQRHGDDGDARVAWYYLALLSTDGLDYVKHLDLFLEHGGRKDRRGVEVELRAGRFYFTQGDYRTALRRFESARDLARRDEDLRESALWLGLTLSALSELSDAKDNLEAAATPVEKNAVAEAALFALGEMHRTAGNYAAAATAYRSVLSSFPAGDYAPAALFGEASARDLLGETGAARALLTRLVADFPGTSEAATARSRLKTTMTSTGAPEKPASAGGPPASPPADDSGYRVQVGAFAQESNALKLADDLNRLGYPGVRIERGDDEDRLYHVRFGPYPDQDRAERAGEQVSAALGLRYRLQPPEEPRP